MIFDAHSNYAKILKNAIPSKILDNNHSNNNDDFVKRLHNGKIKYQNDYFTGSLPKKDYDFLIKKLGAIQTKRGLYIPKYKLTTYYKQQIEKQNLLKEDIVNNAIIAAQGITNNIDKPMVKELSVVIFKRLATNFSKEKLFFNTSQLQIEQTLLNKLEYNTSNGIDFLLKKISNIQDNISAGELTNKINDIFFYQIKNTLLNSVNESLFEIQSKEAEHNGIDEFYWWHRPTLRPTDRMYHREHYNQSKAGKKFSFKNLPLWNGEPDYPGKLWNCHCRAYIRKTEFDRASE